MAEPFTREHFAEWAERLTLDTGEPWRPEGFQLDFVEDVFAGFRECWLIVPQGNTKTTTIAGLSLYVLEHFPDAAIPIAASAIPQANQLYLQAQGFVVRSPWMYEEVEDVLAAATGKSKLTCPRFECQRGFRRVRHHKGGFLEIRASDDRTGDGIIPGGLAICDELHRHRDLELYKTWRGKLRKRNAQMIVISTAGEPGSEFENLREEFRRQAEEVVREETFTRAASPGLAVIHDWSLPEDGDVNDLELVARANPFSQITPEVLRLDRESPSWEMGHWRRFTCNLPTRSVSAAVTEEEWFRNEVPEDIPEGERVWLGIDVGWKHDTTAIQPLWTPSPERRLLGLGRILVPPRDGNTLHPDAVKAAVLEIHERTPAHTVVMDTSAAEDIANWIESELGCVVVDRGQSNAFACDDYEKFMEALRHDWLQHTEDAVFSQHVLNAIARPATYGDLRFDRPARARQVSGVKQDLRVIDGLVAAAMAHALAAVELAAGDLPLAVMV